MNKFKNTLLIIVFNDSKCCYNKDFLTKLYSSHFNNIIYYSHNNTNNYCDNINYLQIEKGALVYNIFNHLYNNYKDLIDKCDGIFYTMDDNIININLLNLYSTDKIIYFYNDLDIPKKYNWIQKYEKDKLDRLKKNNNFKKYNITKFTNDFADFFYLPRKYLTPSLFDLFDIFSRYNIFLELVIPSVINNIEKDKNNYHTFKSDIISKFNNINVTQKYINKSFKIEHNLILHPIKIFREPEFINTLSNCFLKKKCIIIITNNAPTDEILKHINNVNYNTIIVADINTPYNEYVDLNCIFLSLEFQNTYFKKLSEAIPFNNYSRKIIGYLYAIINNYEIIYETDDNIEHIDNFDNILVNNSSKILESSCKYINMTNYFYNNKLWERGFPIKYLADDNYNLKDTNKTPSIISGLVKDNELLNIVTCDNYTVKNSNVFINNNNIAVFNSKNTFWLNKDLYCSLILPSSLSKDISDIFRSLIVNVILQKTNNNLLINTDTANIISNISKDLNIEYAKNINIINSIYDIVSVNSKMKYLYLLTSKNKLTDNYVYFKNKNYILLSYENNSEDTTIYYKNNKWEYNRNKLLEYVNKLNETYDYYIFIDCDNIVIENIEEFCANYENLLELYKPLIAVPYINNYKYYTKSDFNAGKILYFDKNINAFSNKIIKNKTILPYATKYSNIDSNISHYIFINLCLKYNYEVLLFNNLVVNQNTKPNKYIYENIDKYLHKSKTPEWNKIQIKKDIDINYIKSIIKEIYFKLLDNKIIEKNDIDVLNIWLSYF